ncbi:MAG: cytochrome c [Acidimicrobiia bacterium]|jgi:mono/diheme cytochrome c family protein
MGYGYQTDSELEKSTNRVMRWGAVLMLAMALVFPLYRWVEPSSRASAREAQLGSLVTQGESIWSLNCSACHGVNGEGGVGPALNSQQFLQSANNEQITGLVAVGVPGTQMSAYSLDFGGPLTTEQIKAVVTFVRSWEPDAPDNPDWRDTTG